MKNRLNKERIIMTTKKIKRIGVLTGGGDAPGLNAVLRALVKTAIGVHKWEVLGIHDGYDGLLNSKKIKPLTLEDVRGILHLGGTILGTTNRSNPFKVPKKVGGKIKQVDQSDKVIQTVAKFKMDCVAVIGGDGTLLLGNRLFKKGMPMVGIPKTIDNDINATDFTFGFDSAVTTAMEAIDKIHTTAESHHRVMIVEVMGRDVGWIAMHAGLAGGADVILIPEIPYDIKEVVRKVKEREAKGRHFCIIVIGEGAKPIGGVRVYRRKNTVDGFGRLGGIGNYLRERLTPLIDNEIRVTTLGHVQRGGSPTNVDRVLGMRFGHAACRLIAEKKFGHMVALEGRDIVAVNLEKAVGVPKSVPLDHQLIRLAEDIGIEFGR